MNILVNPFVKFDYMGFFTTEERWLHPRRVESTYEIIFVVKGTVCIYDERLGDLKIKQGQLALLEPNTLHYGTEETGDVRFYWVHFSLNGGGLPFSKRLFLHFEQGWLFRELLHLSNLPRTPFYEVNAVLVHILSELCRISQDNTEFDRRAEEIYEWLRINASADLKAELAARNFGFSKDHLSRILMKSYGCGYKELTVRFICEKAKELLCNTGFYIKEIAAILKFPSDKAFIGFFKYHEGVFPEEFRRNFSKTHMNKK